MAELSVVIVSYRTPELLRRCLETLSRDASKRSREIIVVDNDSGDESPRVARSFPGVRVIETGRNLGFAGGVNRGLAEATGRFLAVLNPDIEVRSGALDTLADFLEAHPETGIAAPKLLNPDGSVQYSCRRAYTLTTLLFRRTFLGRLFPNAAPLRRHLMLDYDHASPRAVDWVAGAALMVRREALLDVGPMDERYFLYFEDVDWCTRMQARGWLVHYVPDSVMVHHWQRASRGMGAAARRHLGSGLKFYDRWGGLLFVLRQYRAVGRTVALLLLDLVAVAAAFVVAYAIREQLAFVLRKPVWPLSFYSGFFAASVLVYLGSFASQGLYREVKEGDWVDMAFRVGKGATLGALILMASTFVLDMRAYSRLIVVASWPLAATAAFVVRRLLHALFSRTHRGGWDLKRTALLGEDPVLDRLERILKENPELGWEPVRVKRRPAGDVSPGESQEALLRQLTGERVSEVVVTPRSLGVAEGDLAAAVFPLRRAGFGVKVISSFVSGLPPRTRLERVGGMTWLTLERPALQPAKASKRAFDVVGAVALALGGAIPFLALLAARAVTGKRVWEETTWRGRWGETHRVRKLAGGGLLGAYPLLGSVLRGRFSLVGPRPLGPGEAVPGGESWLRVREHHRPGLVGPWSLSPGLPSEEEMLQEMQYLEQWSVELDLKLLAKAALHGSGSGRGRGSASPAEHAAPREGDSPAPDARQPHSMGFSS